MWFDFDINRLALWVLPPKFQNEKHYAWLKVLVRPLVVLWLSFLDFRKNTKYESYLTGQTFQIQRALNDSFDNTERRIRIESRSSQSLFLFVDADNQPTQDIILYQDNETMLTTQIYLYFENEGADFTEDFRVICPNTLLPKNTQIIALIKKYALADKIFVTQFT
jgi:hypothetical protein